MNCYNDVRRGEGPDINPFNPFHVMVTLNPLFHLVSLISRNWWLCFYVKVQYVPEFRRL